MLSTIISTKRRIYNKRKSIEVAQALLQRYIGIAETAAKDIQAAHNDIDDQLLELKVLQAKRTAFQVTSNGFELSEHNN